MSTPIKNDSAVDTPSIAPWYARRSGTALMLLVTGVVGMIATLILLYERVQLWINPDHVTSCDLNPWVSCGQVMQTWQAGLFGFPNQFIGVAGFPIVITVAMMLLARARPARWFWVSLNVGVFAGFVFCVWLWSQAVYVINILCLYCMVVWAAMIVMTVLLTVSNMVNGHIAVSAKTARAAANWAWPLIILLFVGVAASIAVRFFSALI